MSDDNGSGIAGAIFCVLLVLLAVWWAHAEYADCMKQKHDDIICTTYINSFFN